MKRIKDLQGVTKHLVWAFIGLLFGTLFGWLMSLLIAGFIWWYWPVFGLILGESRAFRSERRSGDKDEPGSTPPTR